MGDQLHRDSPLQQIDKSNVKRLVPTWNLSLENEWGEQAQPLVYDGVMSLTVAKSTASTIRVPQLRGIRAGLAYLATDT